MTEQQDLETLASEIKELEADLMKKKKEYREKKTAALRAALQSREEADKMVKEELKALGYNTDITDPYSEVFPFKGTFFSSPF